ncbi:unnamed protein product [Psylliodes chrysocephalus]|uniref:Uncharacterized protein n=1 Tax=Psylliodes chrysocephalus TaxID=3402493 RepID=A0A9P0D6X4_9CUCU|nr:unnamed protein product [Psylliodes chrysocephala]
MKGIRQEKLSPAGISVVNASTCYLLVSRLLLPASSPLFVSSLLNENGIVKGTKSSIYIVFNPVNLNENHQRHDTHVVVDGGHLLHKVLWPRNASFGEIGSRYVQYFQIYYGSYITVIFDGSPSDASDKNTKSFA